MNNSPHPCLGSGIRLCNRLMLLAVALAGFAHVAFLPAFEGFDEQGHFSYIQQIADAGSIPRPGDNRISAEIESYPGPLRYPTRYPPFDDNGGRTYRSFFEGPLPALPVTPPHVYRPGKSGNNEAQHPPLYYLALAPFYIAARAWSWPSLFLLLRSVSWSMAFAGFTIGALATQRALLGLRIPPARLLLVPAMPFLFPEFFPEMARLGNDSLCLLLMGIGWHLLLQLLERRDGRTAAWLGVILGLGLLTKAFFLPIAAGCFLLLVFAALRERDRTAARNVAVMLAIGAVVGGGWYVLQIITTGSLVGATDMLRAGEQGAYRNLLTLQFSGFALLHSLAGMFASFAWAGTWSEARLPDLFTLPLVLLLLLPLLEWLRQLRHLPTVAFAPLFVVGPMFLGMVYYLLIQVAAVPQGPGAPGWYFHILSAPIGLALALGWRWQRLFTALAIYSVLFHVVVWACQLAMFGGCAYLAGSYRYLQFDFGSCSNLPSRLAVLGEPLLGGVALIAAIAAGGLAVVLAPRLSHDQSLDQARPMN